MNVLFNILLKQDDIFPVMKTYKVIKQKIFNLQTTKLRENYYLPHLKFYLICAFKLTLKCVDDELSVPRYILDWMLLPAALNGNPIKIFCRDSI